MATDCSAVGLNWRMESPKLTDVPCSTGSAPKAHNVAMAMNFFFAGFARDVISMKCNRTGGGWGMKNFKKKKIEIDQRVATATKFWENVNGAASVAMVTKLAEKLTKINVKSAVGQRINQMSGTRGWHLAAPWQRDHPSHLGRLVHITKQVISGQVKALHFALFTRLAAIQECGHVQHDHLCRRINLLNHQPD